MIKLEELQNISKDELINIIGGYVSDQEIWLNQVKELEKQNDRKSAEIEQLTERKERIGCRKQQYLEWVHGFLTTHTEMKNRSEKYKMFDRDWMCEVFWDKIAGSLDYIIDLEEQRNELQKQVDELKAEMHKIESAENETYMLGFEEGEKQTVKDTAKKIFAELFYIASIHHSDVANILAWAKEKAESMDVEVE